MKVIIARDYAQLSQIAADKIAEVIKNKPKAVLGLATGSTPIGMYKQLINYNKEGFIDFSGITTFNLDEYIGLPADHPQSYRYFMDHYFFNHINIDKKKTYIPNGMADNIAAECSAYDEKIRSHGEIDIQILGVGNNGHIGFNEPDHELEARTHIANLKEDTIKANSRFFRSQEEVPTKAITMGMGAIMKAKEIILLASGEAKAEIISKLMEDKIDTQIPASFLQVHPQVTIIVDQSAGHFI